MIFPQGPSENVYVFSVCCFFLFAPSQLTHVQISNGRANGWVTMYWWCNGIMSQMVYIGFTRMRVVTRMRTLVWNIAMLRLCCLCPPESRSKVGQTYTKSYTFNLLLTYFQGPPETYFRTYFWPTWIFGSFGASRRTKATECYGGYQRKIG